MSSNRNSSGRSQAAGTPMSFMTNDVIRGSITRSRARLIAAMNLANQNRDSTPINQEQASTGTVSNVGNENRDSTPINQEQASHLGNQNRDSTPINPELAVLGTVTRVPRELVGRLQPTMALTRLSKELHEMTVNPPPLCSARLIGDDLNKWEATLIGPADSPYANGMFTIHLNFPITYPFSPPGVRFITKIYHCNISKSMICLDLLHTKWSPVLSVSKLLLSIHSLLTDPNPSDPLDLRVADAYLHDRTTHDAIAREWTTLYAMEPPQTQKK